MNTTTVINIEWKVWDFIKAPIFTSCVCVSEKCAGIFGSDIVRETSLFFAQNIK